MADSTMNHDETAEDELRLEIDRDQHGYADVALEDILVPWNAMEEDR